jgi:drug/metabolite transporter (DMT)-like permease
VAVVFALLSALSYGVSDFVGGRASRRVPAVAVAFGAELVLLAVCLAVVPWVESGGPSAAALWWGIAGGVFGSLGVLGLYAVLARGNMTVVAPLTGIVSAVVPVVVALAIGERPGGLAAAGIAVAVVSVALIGGLLGAAGQPVTARTILLAILVGSMFGMLFVAYSRTGDDSGLWPLLTARVGGTPLLLGAFLVARRSGSVSLTTRDVAVPALVVGVLIGLANAAYLAATREGLLSVVAVVVALYPAATVALASIVDHERASRSQLMGMALAAMALTMITLGS